MNNELLEEPKEQKPESQALSGKSVSASTPNNNEELDRTASTPLKKPDNNIPYVLNNKTLNPISLDINPSSTQIGAPNIPVAAPNKDNAFTSRRNSSNLSLPPLIRNQKNDTEPVNEKRIKPMLIIIGLLSLALIITLISTGALANLLIYVLLFVTFANKSVEYYSVLAVIVVYFLAFILTTLIAYRGENNSFLTGLKKVLIFATLLCTILAAITSIRGQTSNISFFSLIPVFIALIIYFVIYFVIKNVAWLIMHKTFFRSKIIFVILFTLIYFLISAICFKIRTMF